MTRPEFIPLNEILARGRSAGVPVASGPEGTKSWEDLMRGVCGWKAAFASRSEPAFTLYEEDGWTFLCALLGAWAAGKHATIPGNALPATLAGAGLPVVRAARSAPAALPGWSESASRRSALTIYTSGSTGRPAAFVKSFEQLGAEVETLEETFGRGLGEAAILSTVSHQHIYGLLFKILWPLCAGRTIHLPTLFYPEEIPAAARLYGSAALVSSPAHLKRLPETLGPAASAGAWRGVFSSGGPLPFAAAAKARAVFGRAPVEVYGSSETGGIAWRESVSENVPWRRFPRVELKLAEATGALCVRSPNLPDGNWFETSDRARMTADGFELLGRLDRIVKVEEKRVSLTALEDVLLKSGLAAEARVVPLTDGGRLGAVVVPTAEGRALDRKVLRERLAAALADAVEKVAVPKRWRFPAALPVNASGKVAEESLLRILEERRLLPEVLKTSKPAPGAAVVALRLPKDLVYFAGHFPSAPILPGVAQIDWAVHYARELLGLDGEFRAIEVLKFQQVLEPGDEPELALAFDAGKGRLKFEYRSGRGRHSSGTLAFRRPRA